MADSKRSAEREEAQADPEPTPAREESQYMHDELMAAADAGRLGEGVTRAVVAGALHLAGHRPDRLVTHSQWREALAAFRKHEPID